MNGPSQVSVIIPVYNGAGYVVNSTEISGSSFISDNYTVDDAQLNAKKVGTLVNYTAATGGYLELNKFFQADGIICSKVPLIAVNSATVGAVMQWANPYGQTIEIVV